MLRCCFWPKVDEDEPNKARQLRKAGRVQTEKKWRRKKERGSVEEQVGKLVVVQKEGGVKEREMVGEEEKQMLEEEEVILEVKGEEQQEVHDPEEMKEEEKQEEQGVEQEVKVEGNDRMEKEILLEELNVETAVVEEEKIQLQKVMEELKDEKKGKEKNRMVVVVIMERKKEEKQQVLDIEEERKVMETVDVLEEVSVESPSVEEEVSVESPAVLEEQKAELENIRDRTEEKDCVAAHPLCLPVCEESSDAAPAEAELIQQLLEELLQEAVMKWTFTASDENVEPSDSHSSAVAQTDHHWTQIKTDWVTKLKEEQEVSLALVPTDRSACTANRADKSAPEPDCQSLHDGFNLDCASVMERNWLKHFRFGDEQLRWSDDLHDVQRPDHHVEEQVCSISGATTDNIRPITVQINDLLLNTAPHSTLIRLDERETNTIKVPFNHGVSVRLQDCEVLMLKMKMMRKRTWSERLTELNEILPVVHPVTSHRVFLIEPLQKFISSANKHLREGNELKLSGQTTTTLTSVYIPEKSELLLDSVRTLEEQEEVKTIRTSSDNNVTDQYQEFEVQILTLKVNWGRKSREKTLRGGLFFMLPKLEVQFMQDTRGTDQEEIV
ncbi:hypothetical protein AOLI_G00246010 [Acnodon oligacanthus]